MSLATLLKNTIAKDNLTPQSIIWGQSLPKSILHQQSLSHFHL
jgi:hypothetical protein